MNRHAESFNTHLGATEMTRRYASASGSSGISTGNQVTMQKGTIGLQSGGLVLVTGALVPSGSNTWFSEVRMKMAGKIGAGSTFTAGVSFRNSGGVQVYWIPVRVDDYRYKIEIRRGVTDTLIDSTGPYFYDKEHLIGFKSVVRTSTNGAYELLVDGDLVLGNSGVNTAGQGSDGADRASLSWGSSGGPQVIMSDWVVTDDVSGGLDDYAGVGLVVLGGTATADGDRLEWTGSSGGAHFSKVNEGPTLFNDSSYVAGETPGAVDLYVYNPAQFAMLGSTATVYAVHLVSMAGMQASGEGDMVGHYKDPGASEADFGDTVTVDSTTQRCVVQIAQENPMTTSPWSNTDITTGQFGPARA